MELLNQSVDQSHWLFRVDPRVKIIFSVTIAIQLVLFNGLVELLILSILPLMVFVIMHGIGDLISRIWGYKWYFLVFIVVLILLTNSIDLELIGSIVLKFVILISAFAVLSQSTNPDQVTDALIKFRLPPQLAWTVGVTLRQFYFMFDEINTILSLNNNYNQNGGKFKIFNRLSRLLIGIYANSIIRARQVSETLQARSYVGAHPEIIYYTSNFTRSDWIYLIILFIPTIVIYTLSSQVFMS